MRYANLSWHAQQVRLAQAEGNLRGMQEGANKMERFGYYKEAWRTFHLIACMEGPRSSRVWRGPRDQTETLFVQPRQRDLGDELRQVHLVARAAQDIANVIVQTESRLVGLFQRSFPNVHFISDSDSWTPNANIPSTTYEQLAFFYAHDEASIRQGFISLTPPPCPDRKPRGLGISWYSKAMYKTLPSLTDWAELLSTVSGRVQSLQYQEGRAGLAELVKMSGRPIKASRTIDQFTDLDGYAGQIASLQRVLTISNTTAHLAGALGIPCVVVLDRDSVTTWPEDRDTSPFYPNTRLIRRRSDDWIPTLNEGLDLLQQIKVEPGSSARGGPKIS